MSRLPVDPRWFDLLQGAAKKQHYDWLAQLSPLVDKVANFGCFNSSESFLLLWILDASEVVVAEKEAKNITQTRDQLTSLQQLSQSEPSDYFGCLDGRFVEFVSPADMTRGVVELASGRYDLAYCDDVLYQIDIHSGRQKVHNAILEMKRVVKPGGWVIAVEDKIGAQIREIPNEPLSMLSRHAIMCPMRVSDPDDISPLFEAAGLSRVGLNGAPEWSYCYKKPLTS